MMMRTRANLRLRNLSIHALNLLPTDWLEWTRLAHRRAAAGLRKRCLARILQIIRYRHPPKMTAVFAVEAGDSLKLTNDGSLIAHLLYWLGRDGYEPVVADHWELCCRQASSVLEIGANIGYMTVRGARACPGTPYRAVEPNPEAVASLRRNIALNRLSNVTVVEAALAGPDAPATLPLNFSQGDAYSSPTGARLGLHGSSVPGRNERIIQVPICDAMPLVEGVDLLKMDVEGAELDILRPLRAFLGAQRTVILIEILDDAHDLRVFLAEFATAFGYRILLLCEPVREVDADDLPTTLLEKHFGVRDALLIPAELSIPG